MNGLISGELLRKIPRKSAAYILGILIFSSTNPNIFIAK